MGTEHDDLDLELEWGEFEQPAPAPRAPKTPQPTSAPFDGLPSQDELPPGFGTPRPRPPPPRPELPTLLDENVDFHAALTALEDDPTEDADPRRTVVFSEGGVERATLPPADPDYFEDALLQSRRESLVSQAERAPLSHGPSIQVDELDELELDLDLDFGLPPSVPPPAPARPMPQIKLTPPPARPAPAAAKSTPAPHPPPNFRIPTGRRGGTPIAPPPPPAPPRAPSIDVAKLEAEMVARFEGGDYGGALHRAERILEELPEHASAFSYAAAAREMLVQLYIGKIGDVDDPVALSLSPAELRELPLDHRTGYLLAQIDGTATLAELLDISSMTPLETARMLHDLHVQGVLAVRPRRR